MTLSATDSSGVLATRYNLDSAGWLTYTVPFGVTGNATHLVEYYSIDNVYNQEDPHPTTIVKIDTVAPTATASTACAGAGGWCWSNATVTLQASDSTSGVTTTHYRVDSGNWNTYIGSTVAFSVTGELTHTVGYYAKDKAGNLGITLTHTVTIDAGPPTTTVSVACAQVGDWCLSTPVTVTLSAQDSASGVAATYYRVGDGNLLTYTNPLVFVTGTYQVSYYSRDKAGYQETSNTRNVRIDLGSMTRIDPSPPLYANSAISLTWVTSQTTPAVAFSTLWVSRTIDGWTSTGLTRTSGSEAFLYTPGGDGRCCFATVGTDAAWNSEAAPTGDGDSCTTYDHTAPTNVTLAATVNGANVALSWDADANVARLNHYDVDVRVEGGAQQNVVSNTTITNTTYAAPPGHRYTFVVTTTDNAGNSASAQTAWTPVKSVRKYYQFGGKHVAMRADGVVYYLHGDHLGSTSLVTNGAGAEVARQMYLPYGAPRWISGTLPTDFTFTGQRADATGLMYYRARYYSSVLGRFVSADTIVAQAGNPADLNRYSYSRNNPLKFVDPSGHSCVYVNGHMDCSEAGAVSGAMTVSYTPGNPYPKGTPDEKGFWLTVGGAAAFSIVMVGGVILAKPLIVAALASCMSNPDRCAESVERIYENTCGGGQCADVAQEVVNAATLSDPSSAVSQFLETGVGDQNAILDYLGKQGITVDIDPNLVDYGQYVPGKITLRNPNDMGTLGHELLHFLQDELRGGPPTPGAQKLLDEIEATQWQLSHADQFGYDILRIGQLKVNLQQDQRELERLLK